MDAPVTKADLDAAAERLEDRIGLRIAEAELRIMRQITRYLGGLSIALVGAIGAGVAAFVLGG